MNNSPTRGQPKHIGTFIPLDLYMVDLGMTSSQAIIAGTHVAARSIASDDQIGTIAIGKFADMLVLKKDPIEDIKVLVEPENIEHIVLNGNFVEQLL